MCNLNRILQLKRDVRHIIKKDAGQKIGNSFRKVIQKRKTINCTKEEGETRNYFGRNIVLIYALIVDQVKIRQ